MFISPQVMLGGAIEFDTAELCNKQFAVNVSLNCHKRIILVPGTSLSK